MTMFSNSRITNHSRLKKHHLISANSKNWKHTWNLWISTLIGWTRTRYRLKRKYSCRTWMFWARLCSQPRLSSWRSTISCAWSVTNSLTSKIWQKNYLTFWLRSMWIYTGVLLRINNRNTQLVQRKVAMRTSCSILERKLIRTTSFLPQSSTKFLESRLDLINSGWCHRKTFKQIGYQTPTRTSSRIMNWCWLISLIWKARSQRISTTTSITSGSLNFQWRNLLFVIEIINFWVSASLNSGTTLSGLFRLTTMYLSCFHISVIFQNSKKTNRLPSNVLNWDSCSPP